MATASFIPVEKPRLTLTHAQTDLWNAAIGKCTCYHIGYGCVGGCPRWCFDCDRQIRGSNAGHPGHRIENVCKAPPHDHRFLFPSGGVQSGKTMVSWLIVRMWVTKNKHLPYAAYLACSPDYKMMTGGFWQAFKEVFWHLGEWNETKKIFTLHGSGHQIFFKSLEYTVDATEGINMLMGAILDEAGKYPYAAYVNIMARLETYGSPAIFPTTPYGMNWLWDDVAEPYELCQILELDDGRTVPFRDLWLMRKLRSVDRPGNKVDLAMQRSRFGNKIVARKYEGEFVQLEGLVYELFTKADNVVEDFEIDPHWPVTAGVDFGTDDPFALEVRAFNPHENQFYTVAEILRSGMSAKETIDLCQHMRDAWNIRAFYYDPSRKDLGMNLKEIEGATAMAAKNALELGIQCHMDLINTRQLKVFESCRNMISSYQSYAYPEHKDKNKKSTEKPLHFMSHLPDAARYNTMGGKGKYSRVSGKVVQLRSPVAAFYKAEGIQDESGIESRKAISPARDIKRLEAWDTEDMTGRHWSQI